MSYVKKCEQCGQAGKWKRHQVFCQGGKIILMSDSCSSDSSAAGMNHVLKYKGIDVSSLLSKREKRERKKTSSSFLADIDVGLSCAEFISTQSCPKCDYYVADLKSDESVYTSTAMFGRCQDPVEPHYAAELELMCKNCKAIRTILKCGSDQGVRVTLRN